MELMKNNQKGVMGVSLIKYTQRIELFWESLSILSPEGSHYIKDLG